MDILMIRRRNLYGIRSVTSQYFTIYTDGSKDGDRVASAAVFGEQVYSAR
jgi:hypothetical protein